MRNLTAMIRSMSRLSRGKRLRIKDLDWMTKHRQAFKPGGSMARLIQWSKPFFPKGKKRLEWLQKLQDRKIRQTVNYAFSFVPAYQEMFQKLGIGKNDIRSREDLQRLPFTTKADLQKNLENYWSRSPACTYTTRIQTSGTSGKPLLMYLTQNEVEYYSALEAFFMAAGSSVEKEDVIQVHHSMDLSTEVLLVENAVRKIGAAMLRFGTHGTLDEHLDSLFSPVGLPGKKRLVSIYMAPPSHVMALIKRAEQRGVRLNQTGVEKIWTGGAKVSEVFREKVAGSFGVPIHQMYSSAEIPPACSIPCTHSDALHFNDFMSCMEVVHPKTGKPVASGEIGVAIITLFYPDREGLPLLRYRLGDLVKVVSGQLCECGSAATKILEVVGREDGMVVIGSRNYFLEEVGQEIASFLGVIDPPEFRLKSQDHPKHGQLVTLEIEGSQLPSSTWNDEQFQEKLIDQVFRKKHWLAEKGMVQFEVKWTNAKKNS